MLFVILIDVVRSDLLDIYTNTNKGTTKLYCCKTPFRKCVSQWEAISALFFSCFILFQNSLFDEMRLKALCLILSNFIVLHTTKAGTYKEKQTTPL